MKKIVFASKNNGKVNEIKKMLASYDIEIVSMKDMGIDIETIEDGSTYEENATKKAADVAKLCNEIVIADDSGIEVEYLGGRPGLYSARYAGEHGSDEANVTKLLEELSGVPIEKRRARYVCSLVAILPDGTKRVTSGEWRGLITEERHGTQSFGYAPIFYDPVLNAYNDELSEEMRYAVNHRGKALREMMKVLNIENRD